MLEIFNEKYQTYSRVSNLRKQIQGWRQGTHETLDAAMGRYYSLLHRCPGHGFSQKEQLRHIVDGLRNKTRETLGISAQGRLSEMTAHRIQRLIDQVAKEEGELIKRESAEEYNRDPSIRKRDARVCDTQEEETLDQAIRKETLPIQKSVADVAAQVAKMWDSVDERCTTA